MHCMCGPSYKAHITNNCSSFYQCPIRPVYMVVLNGSVHSLNISLNLTSLPVEIETALLP